MKIIESKSGEAYHLTPGTKLEIERTNLFFNEYGEQSLPVDLPTTNRNRRILEYPDILSRKKKKSADIEAVIEDNGFYSSCRQAILSVTQGEKISTAFYLNEGSFLAQVNNTTLSEIFGEEQIEGVKTVDQAISFCRELIKGNNLQYVIFPVLIDSDETYDDGRKKFKYINRFGYQREQGWDDSPSGSQKGDFYNAVQREEKVGEKTVTLPKGFYMSPFIRANYLLKRILQYYGYTLKDNFFTKTAPFTSMAIVNNTADAIVRGSIRLLDLLPDCTAADILNVFRKKFCCEFLVDEVKKEVDICLFKDVIKGMPQIDLTAYMVNNYEIDFPDSYKRITLYSDNVLSDNQQEEKGATSVSEILNKFPGSYWNEVNGTYYRPGYRFDYREDSQSYKATELYDLVAPASVGYDSDGPIEAMEINVPDLFPEFKKVYLSDSTPEVFGFDILYIGGCRFLNSSIVASDPRDEAQTQKSNNSDLKPILAFFYNTPNWSFGTITGYGFEETPNGYKTKKIAEYTLCYWGENGLYEKFYKDMDDLYRNSLHQVKARLLLPSSIKQSIKAEIPVILMGQKVLFNSFNYVLGTAKEPVDSSFYTMRIHEPATHGMLYHDIVQKNFDMENLRGWIWVLKSEDVEVSESEYDELNTSPYPMYLTLYPSEQYVDGKRYFEQSWYYTRKGTSVKRKVTYWCECEYFDWAEG